MILAVNIGNTNIRAAVGNSDKIIAQTVVYADEGMDKVKANLSDTWDEIEGCLIATVVPQQTKIVTKFLEENKIKPIKRVDIKNCGELKTNKYEGLLGEDRVVCCARALQKFTAPFVVIDYGTATTINVVNSNKEFVGGAILAGLQTNLDVLSKNTAQLPRIGVTGESVPLIGKNTVDNLLSGAIYGQASATEGIINRMQEELACKLPVIVTGGHGPYVLPYCRFEYTYEPTLLLDGLLAMYS